VTLPSKFLLYWPETPILIVYENFLNLCAQLVTVQSFKRDGISCLPRHLGFHTALLAGWRGHYLVETFAG
ncbi:hypothetical protein, partial [Brucella intermedia]|uniref:hypothetical protein n=1 Tax=Brucella intermedia TaxID=94625 RepID=UPI0023603263